MDIRNQNYFTEDFDAFEQFIQDRLTELTDRHNGAERFPVEGLARSQTTDTWITEIAS